jgi:hypothetical protein
MSIGASRILGLIGRLVAESADARDVAADSVTDWVRTFDSDEAAVISRILLWLALIETDDVAREAQLHALAEMAEDGKVLPGVLRDVDKLAGTDLRGSSVEHFNYLQSLRADDS